MLKWHKFACQNHGNCKPMLMELELIDNKIKKEEHEVFERTI